MAGGGAGGGGARTRAPVVADAGPLIALERIGHATLLGALFHDVLVPPAVVREVGWTVRPAWLHERSVSRPPAPDAIPASLHPGEREAIALALELGAGRLLIDERRGRHSAQRLGVRVTGTIGILLLAKVGGFLPNVLPTLEALVMTGFRIDAELFAYAVRESGEDAIDLG